METLNLQAIFGADTSDFEDGINRVSQLGEKFNSQMKELGKNASKAFATPVQINPMLDLIHQLGKALEQYAEILISTGTAMLIAGDPAGSLKLGEGVALEAIGAAAQAVKMASGGLVSGSAFVNVGEYAGATRNPEVIAPLDKLKGMLGNNSPSNFTFRIQGDELVAILDRVDKNNGYVVGE